MTWPAYLMSLEFIALVVSDKEQVKVTLQKAMTFTEVQ